MNMSLTNRAWDACSSALQFDRYLAGEMDPPDAERFRAHAGACARCASVLSELREESKERLPPLRVVPFPRRSLLPVRVLAAAAGIAAAASLLLVMRPASTGLKGSGFSLSMYVEHQGEVRRAGPGETLAPGDSVRFAVSSPLDVFVAVLSLDANGHGSIYFPAGGRAQRVQAGADVPLPLGTRLDATVGEERILGLFCASPVELEPLREQLERGDPAIPDGCQVTRWSFVKR
jgi:ferric-dicitrate binding protein FerR (iron transport regulator)